MVTLWYIAAVPAGSFRVSSIDIHGVGMTSQRTRERLVQRLREGGISDPRVLEAMRSTPRHLFRRSPSPISSP